MAVFYDLKSKNAWKRIEELYNKGLLSREGADNFAWAINEIAQFRVRTHMHYGSENEKVYYQPQSEYETFQWSSGNYYVLEKADLKKISTIFQFILPVYQAAKRFCETYGQVNPFKDSQLMVEGFEERSESLILARDFHAAKELCINVLALDPTNIKILTRLGLVFQTLSQYAEATDYFKKSIEEFERKFLKTQDQWNDKIAMGYITLLQHLAQSLLNNPSETLSSAEKAIRCYKKYVKEERPLLASLYVTMSMPLIRDNKFKDAIYYLEEARRIHSRFDILENTFEFSSALTNLGYVYTKVKNYVAAIDCFKHAIALGGSNGGIRLVHLGIALAQSGKALEGIEKLKEALVIQEKNFGKVNADVATTLSHLGHTHHMIQDYKHALFYFKQELYVNQQIYGFWHETNIEHWNNLAEVANSAQNYDEALIYYKSTLEVKIKCFGKNDPRLILTYCDISRVEMTLKNYGTSIEYADKALSIFTEKNSVEYAAFLNFYGHLLQEKDPKKAIDILLQSWDLTKKFYGIKSLQAAQCLSNLGYIHQKINKTKEAISFYKQSYSIFLSLLGSSNASTKNIYNVLKILAPQGAKALDDNDAESKQVIQQATELFNSISLEEMPIAMDKTEGSFFVNKAKPQKDPQNQFIHETKNSNAEKDISYKIIQEISNNKENIEDLKRFYPFNPNLTDKSGNSLLHFAVETSNYKAMEFLCDKGANINLANDLGVPPLFHAASIEKLPFFLYLAKNGAQFNFKLKRNDFTFLHECAAFGNIEAIEFILKNNLIAIDALSKEGFTPLYMACQKGCLEAAKFLISRGANVNKQSFEGFTPISTAIMNNHSFVVYLLLDHQADISTKFDGENVIFIAIGLGCLDAVKVLTQRVPDMIHIPNDEGIKPIFHASNLGQAEIVSLLIEQGAEPVEKNKSSSCLQTATIKGHLEVVKILHKHTDKRNIRRCIYASICFKHDEILDYLLEHEEDAKNIVNFAFEASPPCYFTQLLLDPFMHSKNSYKKKRMF